MVCYSLFCQLKARFARSNSESELDWPERNCAAFLEQSSGAAADLYACGARLCCVQIARGVRRALACLARDFDFVSLSGFFVGSECLVSPKIVKKTLWKEVP